MLEDINEISGADRVQSNSGNAEGGKKTSVVGIEAIDGVELFASDPDLLEGVRSKLASKVGSKPKQAQNSISENKTGAMKDLANVLEARPIKLKPGWAGLKNGRGSVLREVGITTGWVKHGTQTGQIDRKGTSGNSLNKNGGPLPSCPPNLAGVDMNLKSLDPTSSTQSERNEGGEENGEDGRSEGKANQ